MTYLDHVLAYVEDDLDLCDLATASLAASDLFRTRYGARAIVELCCRHEWILDTDVGWAYGSFAIAAGDYDDVLTCNEHVAAMLYE